MAIRACIHLDKLVSTEHKQLDRHLVDRVARLFKTAPKNVPPALGIFEETARGERVHVTDGHHRMAAARQAGLPCLDVLNASSMNRSDRASYTRAVNKYRKLIEHPAKRGK